MIRRFIYTLIAACALTGCNLYKPYSRPAELGVDIDSLYRVNQSTDTTSIAGIPWREFFTDPQLAVLIERGLQQNTDLQIAMLRVDEASAALKAAKLAYLPSLNLVPQGGISSFAGQTTKTYNLAANASWEIDIFGKLTNAKRGALAAMQQTEAYSQAVKTNLIATIAGSYYTLLMLDEQLNIARQTCESWVEMEQKLEALKRAGRTNEAGILQARATRIELEGSILTLEHEIATTENALSSLLGETPQTFRRGKLAEQSFPESLAVGVPLQLLANRPDVRAAEFALAQSYYAVNQARASFYPSITLSGTLGWTNDGGGVEINPGKWLMNAIAGITQPLFNRGALTANLTIAKDQQEEAALQFRQSLLNAGNEVNDALSAWQTANNRLQLDQQQTDTLTEALRKTELLMQHSNGTYLEVLTARQSLLNSRLTHAQDNFNRIQAVITLYHALGGGLNE